MVEFSGKENIKGKWRLIKLTEEEVGKALDEVSEYNIKLASKLKNRVDSSILPVLLDKTLISGYTYLSHKISEKADKMNNEPSKPRADPTQPIVTQEIEKKVDEQMNKPPQDLAGKDIIGEALVNAK